MMSDGTNGDATTVEVAVSSAAENNNNNDGGSGGDKNNSNSNSELSSSKVDENDSNNNNVTTTSVTNIPLSSSATSTDGSDTILGRSSELSSSTGAALTADDTDDSTNNASKTTTTTTGGGSGENTAVPTSPGTPANTPAANASTTTAEEDDLQQQLANIGPPEATLLGSSLMLVDESCHELFAIPANSVTAETVPRQCRTQVNVLEQNAELFDSVVKEAQQRGGPNPNVEEFLHSFFGDLTLVHHPQREARLKFGDGSDDDLSDGDYESDDDGLGGKEWSPDDAVIMSGYLQKRPVSKAGKRTLAQSAKWKLKKRWFLLSEFHLSYFAGEQANRPLGSWRLESMQIDPEFQEKDSQFLITLSYKQYCIQADSAEMKKKWVDAIKRTQKGGGGDGGNNNGGGSAGGNRLTMIGKAAVAAAAAAESNKKATASSSVTISASTLSLFHNFHLAVGGNGMPWMHPVETRLAGRPVTVEQFREEGSLSLMISCKELTFGWGNKEPFFCSLFVVDLGGRIKSTESFYFDLNGLDYLKQKFGEKLGEIDPVSRSRRAVFNISKPCGDMYLVLWVDKVLQQANTKVIKPYLKEPEKGEKFQMKIDKAIKRFWCFRQPFVWGFLPLFRRTPAGFAVEQGKRVFERLYRIEGDVQHPFDIFEFINYAEKPSNYNFIPASLKEKLNASFTCSVRLLTKPPGGCVDTELQLLKEPTELPRLSGATPSDGTEDSSGGGGGGGNINNSSNSAAAAASKNSSPSTSARPSGVGSVMLSHPLDAVAPIREMMELDRPSPLSDFVHSLFVYPEALNMVNRLLSVTVVVKVSLKDSDADPNAEGLAVFYCKSSGPRFSTHAYSQVTYKNNHPQFHDEIKLRMPLPLRSSHHILFSFYNIDKSRAKIGTFDLDGEGSGMKQLGYAVVPLYEQSMPVWTERPLDIPLVTHLPPGYMSMLPSLQQAAEREQRIFSVRISFASILYPQEPRLALLLKVADHEMTTPPIWGSDSILPNLVLPPGGSDRKKKKERRRRRKSELQCEGEEYYDQSSSEEGPATGRSGKETRDSFDVRRLSQYDDSESSSSDCGGGKRGKGAKGDIDDDEDEDDDDAGWEEPGSLLTSLPSFTIASAAGVRVFKAMCLMAPDRSPPTTVDQWVSVEVPTIVQVLRSVPPIYLLRFFPPLFNIALRLLCQAAEARSRATVSSSSSARNSGNGLSRLTSTGGAAGGGGGSGNSRMSGIEARRVDLSSQSVSRLPRVLSSRMKQQNASPGIVGSVDLSSGSTASSGGGKSGDNLDHSGGGGGGGGGNGGGSGSGNSNDLYSRASMASASSPGSLMGVDRIVTSATSGVDAEATEFEVFLGMVHLLSTVRAVRLSGRFEREIVLQDFSHRIFDNVKGTCPNIALVILTNMERCLLLRANRPERKTWESIWSKRKSRADIFQSSFNSGGVGIAGSPAPSSPSGSSVSSPTSPGVLTRGASATGAGLTGGGGVSSPASTSAATTSTPLPSTAETPNSAPGVSSPGASATRGPGAADPVAGTPSTPSYSSTLDAFIDAALEFSWFWFDLVVKSLILTAKKEGFLNDPHERKSRWRSDLYQQVSSLGSLIRTELAFAAACRNGETRHLVTKEEFEELAARYEFYFCLNRNFALFLRDLFSVLDPARLVNTVNDLISLPVIRELKTAAQQMTLDFRRQSLEILLDYEHILSLSSPAVIRVLPRPKDCTAALYKRFFLSTRMIAEVEALLTNSEWPDKARESAVEQLTKMLAKIDCDKRYQSPEARRIVAGMHLGLVFMLGENTDAFEGEFLSMDSRRSLLLSAAHILHNVDLGLLKPWWRGLCEQREEDFRAAQARQLLAESLAKRKGGKPTGAASTASTSGGAGGAAAGAAAATPSDASAAGASLSGFFKMLRNMVEAFDRKAITSEASSEGGNRRNNAPAAATSSGKGNEPGSPVPPGTKKRTGGVGVGTSGNVNRKRALEVSDYVHRTVLTMISEFVALEPNNLRKGGVILDDLWAVVLALLQHAGHDELVLALYKFVRNLLTDVIHDIFFEPKNVYWRDLCGDILRVKIRIETDRERLAPSTSSSSGLVRVPSQSPSQPMSPSSSNNAAGDGDDDLGMGGVVGGGRITEEVEAVAEECLRLLCEPYADLCRIEPDVQMPELDEETEDSDLKVGTVEQIIDRLCHQRVQPAFGIDFFLTYRSFAEPRHLLKQLMQRYVWLQRTSEVSQDGAALEGSARTNKRLAQLRVCNTLKYWVEKHFHDFDSPLLACLLRLVGDHLVDKKFATTLKKSIQKMLSGRGEMQVVFNQDPPKPMLANRGKLKTATLLDWPTIEIARQLTLIEYDLFRRIQPQEFIGQSWSKKDKETKAPNILRFIQRFNLVSRWVGSCIVMEEDLKTRRALVVKFYGIAKACADLNNYNAVLEIVSGLHNAAIDRMKKTFENMPEQLCHDMEQLTELMSEKKSYKNFRDTMQKVNPPCIPYLGVYLTDLTFIDDGNKNTNEQGLVNLQKGRLLGEVIRKIQIYQQTPYCLETVVDLRRILSNSKVLDENEMYRLSLLREPREAK